ncbi:DUF3231 family protein [Bacillus sp. FJAT-42376]|uniref:DUF3231 family protein n=1 Tax=Bacillus sp. FJAT-42376 TaxID=2014076 RepID=UPI000F4ED1E6|nr:DUF3231 family protein [Bacillus sp. FJAT-42376]AZB41799.1 DUF3231 family protein [Bacillus sp. FJAT-42376]
MSKTRKMSAAEFGALWTTYHKKTMILRILEGLIGSADDEEAKSLMSDLHQKLDKKVLEMETLIANEGAAVPAGFTSQDVHPDAPKLFDNELDIMFCRVLKEISMGMYVLHMTISYREDIIEYYTQLTELTQAYYLKFTQYLTKKNLLPIPNYSAMPKSGGYITDPTYTKGLQLFGEKRPLNTIEYGILYHSIETNIFGMELMKAFAQCSKDEEVKKYFIKGHELAKEILQETNKVLLKNDIQPPASSGGTLTSSTTAPFSEYLMLYCTYLLGGFGLGSQGFTSAFALRSDLSAKSAVFAKDTFEYTTEGAKLMMEKGWLEEPPGMHG